MAKSPQYDIFLSYASFNNDDAAPNDRWVTRFHDSLLKRLKQELGEEPNIFFDVSELESNQQLEEILDACRNSRLFIAVSSPAYHKRPWTRRELDAFVRSNPDPSCLFVVELAKPEHVDSLKEISGYHVERFHQRRTMDAHTNVPMQPGEDAFYQRVSDLASAICKQLSPELAKSAPKRDSKPILLAQVTDDLEDDRSLVRSQLEQFGYTVLPKQHYPLEGKAFQAAVAADLKECGLFVQLLGPHMGRTPPDLTQGYACAQLTEAQKAGVPVFQWRRPTLTVNEAEVPSAAQRALLTGDKVTACTMGEFKTLVLQKLEQLNAPLPVAAREAAVAPSHAVGAGGFRLFINSQKMHRGEAEKIFETLRTECSVALPPAGEGGSNRARFKDLLSKCHGLLLLHGSADSDWTIDQLEFAEDVRGGKPLVGAVCYGPGVYESVGFSIPRLEDVHCKNETGTDWDLDSIFKSFPDWVAAHRAGHV